MWSASFLKIASLQSPPSMVWAKFVRKMQEIGTTGQTGQTGQTRFTNFGGHVLFPAMMIFMSLTQRRKDARAQRRREVPSPTFPKSAWWSSRNRGIAIEVIRKSSGSESDRIRVNPAFSFFYFLGKLVAKIKPRQAKTRYNKVRQGIFSPPTSNDRTGSAFGSKGFLKVLKGSKGKISNLFLFFYDSNRDKSAATVMTGPQERPLTRLSFSRSSGGS